MLITRLNELDQIPKIFFDSDFSLSNKETFNSLISLRIFENNAASSGGGGGGDGLLKQSGSTTTANGSVIGLVSSKNKLDEIESRKFILDKVKKPFKLWLKMKPFLLYL